MRWVRLTTAPNEPIGESWAELLRRHGLPAYVRAETVVTLITGGSRPVALMVPEERREEGLALLERLVGPWEE